MKLYLVRHGESEGNEKAAHQTSETSLSRLGLEQAELLAERFINIPIDLILSSPYRRAQQTAELISKKIGKSFEVSPLAHEAKRPSVIEGRLIDEPEVVAIKEDIKKNIRNADWRHSNEENVFDLRGRVIAFIQSLNERSEENILVVSHGTFMRMILAVLMYGPEFDPTTFPDFQGFFWIGNTGLTLCEKDDKGRWKLIAWNDQAHLGE